MKDRNVIFKKVTMDRGTVVSSVDVEGKVLDEFTDHKEKNGKLIENKYYIVADADGIIHQVRPFNIVRVLS